MWRLCFLDMVIVPSLRSYTCCDWILSDTMIFEACEPLYMTRNTGNKDAFCELGKRMSTCGESVLIRSCLVASTLGEAGWRYFDSTAKLPSIWDVSASLHNQQGEIPGLWLNQDLHGVEPWYPWP